MGRITVSDILWKIKNVPNHQPVIIYSRSLIVLCSHLPHYINPCKCVLLPSRVNKCHLLRLQDTDRPYLCFLRLAPMTIVTRDCRKAPDKGALIHLHHSASARTNSAPKSQISWRLKPNCLCILLYRRNKLLRTHKRLGLETLPRQVLFIFRCGANINTNNLVHLWQQASKEPQLSLLLGPLPSSQFSEILLGHLPAEGKLGYWTRNSWHWALKLTQTLWHGNMFGAVTCRSENYAA